MKIIGCIILLFVLLLPRISFAESYPVEFLVICEDKEAKELIEKQVTATLSKYNQFDLNKDEFPVAVFYIMANQDIDSAVNTNGWTFAIAHITNQKVISLVNEFGVHEGLEFENMYRLLAGLIEERGFLKHLNIAHTDSLTKTSLKEIIDQFILDFAERIATYKS